MSGSKHTPGPWTVDPEDAKFVIAPDADGGEPWQVARAAEFAGPGEATIPNARLIAAAPDLLEACQAVADVCSDHGERRMESDGYTALELVLSAISKATGEA